MRFIKHMGLGCALVLLTFSAGAQQSTANLGGKVLDAQGRIVPGAVVDLTSQETGNQWHVKTNKGGSWLVESLVPGHYTFTVSDPGFKTEEHSAIELQVADQKYIDTTLEVGAITETVVVSSTTPLIDTTSAVSGTVITGEQLQTIPSYTNSPIPLAALAPGVTMGSPSGGAAHLWSNNSESELAANEAGSGSNAVNYQIDGGSNTNGSGQIAFIPPMDAIGEFRVSTNAYDASISRTAAATIDMSVRSGGRAFHGTVYEFNQTNMLNAIPYNNGVKNAVIPPVHDNEYGVSIGGPIWIPKVFDGRKRHTFFFLSYDGIRNNSPGNTGYMSLPTLAERNGDFSHSFTTNGGVVYPILIYDPASTKPTTGARTLINNGSEMLTANQISPIAKAIFSLLPPPDNAGDGSSSDSNNYNRREVKTDRFNSYILRLDNAITERHHTYAQYRQNALNEVSGDPFGTSFNALTLDGQILIRKNYGLTLDHAWVVSPNFLLDFHGNATLWRTTTVSTDWGNINPAEFGFAPSLLALSNGKGLPQISGVGSNYENGGYGTDQAPSYTYDALYEGRVTASHTLGNHSIKYGFDYLIQQEADGNLGTAAGSFGFGTNWTSSNPLTTAVVGSNSSVGNTADFELGLATSGSIPNNATSFWTQPFVGVFFQDDWRVTSRLTVNLGLRWDYQEGLTERDNRFFSIFNPNTPIDAVTAVAQPAYTAVLAGSASNLGVQYLQQNRPNASTFVARGAVAYAGVNGTSRDVTGTTMKYFQPRVGFAYRIHPDTVIRAGLGRFTEANFVEGHGNQTGYSTSTPFTATNDNYLTMASTLANPFPTGEVPVTGNSLGALTSVGSVSSFYQPQVPRQYTDEASVHLQQQVHKLLFELGATLNITHGLSVGYDVNQPSLAAWTAANTPLFSSAGLPSATLPGNTQVPNPFLGAPYITSSLETAKTIAAYQLSRPNPLISGLTENIYNGKNIYYAGQSKLERRYSNGLAFIVSFTWSKAMSETSLVQPQPVSQKLLRQLSGGDQRFLYNINPTYALPFGRGQYFGGHVNRLTDLAIGGWQLSGIFTFNSGTPVSLPTNSSFFLGGDPGIGSSRTRQHQFNTSKFVQFPTISTTVAQLQAYPSWTGVTGLPGANYNPPTSTSSPANGVYQDFATWQTRNPTNFGDVRNPPTVNLDMGLRKAFPIHEQIRLELRFDAFNALNHVQFTGPGTGAGSTYFGYLSNSSLLSQANAPRAVQLAGKIYF